MIFSIGLILLVALANKSAWILLMLFVTLAFDFPLWVIFIAAITDNI